MANFYPFAREVDSSDYIYTFLTDSKILYSVEFQGSTYQEYANFFPALMKFGYGLVVSGFPLVQSTKRNFDVKIKTTICEILRSHFYHLGNETVLLYHCDSSDGMQRQRSITFNAWYNEINYDGLYLKESLVYEFLHEKTYMGYITPKSNPNLLAIQAEFNEFAMKKIDIPK
jgi:hypothetical protein